jgi:hypothetical protein
MTWFFLWFVGWNVDETTPFCIWLKWNGTNLFFVLSEDIKNGISHRKVGSNWHFLIFSSPILISSVLGSSRPWELVPTKQLSRRRTSHQAPPHADPRAIILRPHARRWHDCTLPVASVLRSHACRWRV